MAQEWEIKALGHVCAGTQEPFADGQPLISCLFRGEEGYERRDYSEAGWEAAPKEGVVSFWKTIYRAPPPPSPEPLKKETAETLLRQYMTKEDFSRINAIYILAVMLERKRILLEKDVQTREDGAKIRIYEHKKTGEVFTIPDPQLKLTELETVQAEVEDLLGFNAPEEPASSEAPSA
ncbi:MAG: hypothetical protein M9963_02520 [Kiritimatiellae bacterium]|nr:hypothetical protein [Kiritimatiellia bacterium]MCO5060868.1 hypothetical protein [Kiritimatiellia bacterium]MCO6401728.1 hypothetical protein [Verrucomicrobiota bacterium]